MMSFLLILLTICINLQLIQSLSCSYSTNKLPLPLKAHQMVYSESLGRVYIFGGLTVNNARSNTIYKWDTSDPNDWFTPITETTPGINFFSHSNNVVMVNNRVYFIGLYDVNWNTIYIFDMETDSFIDNSKYPLLPVASSGGCLVTDGIDNIYMIGGRLSGVANSFSNQLQIYSISQNTWSAEEMILSPLHRGWGYQNCEIVGNKLYVFGGNIGDPDGETDKYFKYTLDLKIWTTLDRKSSKSNNGASAYYNGKIYNIAGATGGSTESDIIDVFDVSMETIIHSGNYMMAALSALESLVINGKLYIFGGWNGNYNPNGISDGVQVCEFDPTPPTTTSSYLTIRNCDGANNNDYKAEVLNVPNGISLDYVKMRDESGNNEWLEGTYNPITECYEWTNGIKPYQLPFDFKIKANDIKIKAMNVIDSFDIGTQGDMKDNFAAYTQNELKSDPLITSSHSDKSHGLFIALSSPIFIICVIVLLVVIMIFLYYIKTRRGRGRDCDSKTHTKNIEMDENKTDENEMEVKVSCDTQINAKTVEDEIN